MEGGGSWVDGSVAAGSVDAPPCFSVGASSGLTFSVGSAFGLVKVTEVLEQISAPSEPKAVTNQV